MKQSRPSIMKNSYTLNVFLGVIEDASWFLAQGYKSPGWGLTITDLRRIEDAKERRRTYQAIKRIERQGKWKVKREGDRLAVQLTTDGHVDALKKSIISSKKQLPEWEVCLVVFDVPEDIRWLRSEFRELLKRADFYPIQRSVWEGEKDVVEELFALIDVLKVEKYLRIYRAVRTHL